MELSRRIEQENHAMLKKLTRWLGFRSTDTAAGGCANTQMTPNTETSVRQDLTMQDSTLRQPKPITMYATRFCPYCMRARSLFGAKGWEFHEIAVDADPEQRQIMMEKSGRHTVPQIWIGEQHIGVCDELMQLEMSGQLDQLA